MRREDFILGLQKIVEAGMPFVLTLLIIAILMLPTPDFALARFAPALGLVYVFHFSVFRPSALPYWLAFLMGLVTDLWATGPLGLNALLLYFMAVSLVPQERFFKSITFPVLWLLFVILVLIWLLAHWLVGSLYYMMFLSPKELFFQAALAIAIFPLLSRMYAWLNKLIGGEAPAVEV